MTPHRWALASSSGGRRCGNPCGRTVGGTRARCRKLRARRVADGVVHAIPRDWCSARAREGGARGHRDHVRAASTASARDPSMPLAVKRLERILHGRNSTGSGIPRPEAVLAGARDLGPTRRVAPVDGNAQRRERHEHGPRVGELEQPRDLTESGTTTAKQRRPALWCAATIAARIDESANVARRRSTIAGSPLATAAASAPSSSWTVERSCSPDSTTTRVGGVVMCRATICGDADNTGRPFEAGNRGAGLDPSRRILLRWDTRAAAVCHTRVSRRRPGKRRRPGPNSFSMSQNGAATTTMTRYTRTATGTSGQGRYRRGRRRPAPMLTCRAPSLRDPPATIRLLPSPRLCLHGPPPTTHIPVCRNATEHDPFVTLASERPKRVLRRRDGASTSQ